MEFLDHVVIMFNFFEELPKVLGFQVGHRHWGRPSGHTVDREIQNQELDIMGSNPGSATSRGVDLGWVTYPLCISVSAVLWDGGSSCLVGLRWYGEHVLRMVPGPQKLW